MLDFLYPYLTISYKDRSNFVNFQKTFKKLYSIALLQSLMIFL
ncbi:hypothetical protein BD809_102464 [Aquimarina intermedia]|uniref:Uncharacterized protein n=1 Tax=Aquimarina intermedia TaxID=350814 RepID=A0A5S5CD42_9FLAO|nr:hypothetical protein BD809_102464 [Aquimarina intermedia]